MKLQKTTILLFLAFTAISMGIHAQIVQSITNGNWSVGTTWSTGTVPTGQEDIRIGHKVYHTNSVTVLPIGKLTILSGGKLSIAGELESQGIVYNYDSLTMGTGLDSRGSIFNYGTWIQTGTMELREGGLYENHGNILLTGDIENYGTFLSTSTCYMTGDLENHGLFTSPSGESAYFEVCGSATHRDRTTVSGLNYLCIRCGGSYNQEPRRIGDFILECNPFAVTLINFEGDFIPSGIVKLRWQTVSETSNSWFVIERAFVSMTEQCLVGKCESENGFVEIGRVPGAGGSSTLRSYIFTDPFPKAGINFYRLKMVDINNNFTYSPTVSVVVNTLLPTILAFPNPTQETLHLKISGNPSQEASISMYNVEGKLVWRQNNPMIDGRAEIEISTCDFASGTYILEFKQGERKDTKKVVFQK